MNGEAPAHAPALARPPGQAMPAHPARHGAGASRAGRAPCAAWNTEVNRMETTEKEQISDSYGWLTALGVMYLALMIILCGPEGLVFDAVRGLLTGLALCTGIVYIVVTFLPDKYR